MKLNTQPIEHMELHKQGSLETTDVWRTIQGEGPFAGRRAVFVRLAGCNLQCPLCDTDYTKDRLMSTYESLVAEIDELVDKWERSPNNQRELVVLTGGEPFRQNIGPFLFSLVQKKNYIVQIETNGTIFDESVRATEAMMYNRNVSVVCSPKSRLLNKKLSTFVDGWKYVLQAGHVDKGDGLPTSVLGNKIKVARPRNNRTVYVQPLDEEDEEKNKANLNAAVESCIKFGYTLSLQTHKLLGMK